MSALPGASRPALRVDGLAKEYRLGVLGHGSLRKDLQSWWARLNGREDPNACIVPDGGGAVCGDRVRALHDVSFEVGEGEVLGIVGRNGSGKSTLLKIISRVTTPTRGEVRLRGRVASLLEVGTGFHPELTGRENVFLNGAILGMRQGEIRRAFDEIVSFAEVGEFVDTPVKRYSSGMYTRLAFAVAAHLDAEILVVDEVLAVGDAEFQKRCLGKMEAVARGGRTVLFVSHNLTAVRNLCSRGLLIDAGRVAALGPVGDVLAEYARLRKVGEHAVALGAESARPGAPAYLLSVSVAPRGGGPSREISLSTPFAIAVAFRLLESDSEVGVFLHCYSDQAEMVFSTGSFFEPGLNGLRLEAGVHEFTCAVPAPLLNDGEYTLDVMLVRRRHEVVVTEASVLSFSVHAEALGVDGWNWRPVGVVRPQLRWEHRRGAE
jgi:lipopolysaccharide transport system ATP-binding protein